MNGYALFWGCTIPARFPFMEKSMRSVLNILDVDYQDLDGFTCCPEKSLVKNFNPALWELTAARNVSLAERAGLNIITPCNGCYGTLKGISSRLRTFPVEANRANEALAPLDLAFHGRARVEHLIEFLHDQLGLGKIRAKVVFPLRGMRLAVHGGCHLVRPSNAIHFDDPIKPAKFDALVAALGAESVDHSTKLTCCGGYLSRVGMQELNLTMAGEKLKELTELGVDALTTCCPECFKIFDSFQPLLQKKGAEVSVPILTISELAALAFGVAPEELGLKDHRVDVSPFLQKFEAIRRELTDELGL
ncbi:MAG: CoB--CoM heterodisulfide reductase iron-sulfur subunit B family protein [Thermodesulfobacteriota bacterium]